MQLHFLSGQWMSTLSSCWNIVCSSMFHEKDSYENWWVATQHACKMFSYISTTFFWSTQKKSWPLCLQNVLCHHTTFFFQVQRRSLSLLILCVLHLNEEVINTTYQNEQGRNFGSDMISMRAGDRHKPWWHSHMAIPKRNGREKAQMDFGGELPLHIHINKVLGDTGVNFRGGNWGGVKGSRGEG